MAVEFVNVKHKLISEDGWSLWLPGKVIRGLDNLNEPDIYAESATQLYPLGAKLEYADGRVFRYAKWAETTTRPTTSYNLVVNANACPMATGYEWTDGFEGNLYAAAAVGATYVDLWTIIAASGTGIRTTAFAENHFEDGMLAVFPSGGCAEYRICGSDVTTEVSATADYTRVYLDEPLKVACTVGTTGAYITGSTPTGSVGGTGITAYPSIFSQVKMYGSEGAYYTSVVGACLVATTITSGSFGWVQRKGRCIVGPTAYFGDSVSERMAEPHQAGTGEMALRTAYTTQPIGYLTQRTVSGYGDLETWLQLE
jgi:hypothetical protein